MIDMRLGISLLLLLLTASASAQNKPAADPNEGWHLLDRQKDHVNGISVNKAYEQLLKGKKSHPVVVAVISTKASTPFSKLSASGGIVNAYEALKLAGKMTSASPKKPL